MSREVIARYRDLDDAREALAALERGGIDGADISLEGRRAARAAAEHDTARRDRAVTRQVGSRVALGGVAGAVLAAVVGLVIGSVAFTGSAAMWSAAVAGGIAGGVIGAAIGGYATPAMSEEWELTHEPEPDGSVAIRVTSDDPAELDRAAEILTKKDALSVDRGRGA
jgi:outer membrane lipoprotein SlyB